MKSLRLVLMTAAGSLVLSLPVFAQNVAEAAAPYPGAGSFFMAVIAGLLLAIGFQVLLTNLSVAMGITGVGNLEKKGGRTEGKDETAESHEEEEDRKAPLFVKISGAFGLWTLFTVSVSLFFASLLAVKLSMVPAAGIGVTLGLVIWAAFFTAMAYLEAKSISTLAGSVMSTAMRGIRSVFGGASHAAASSPEAKAEKLMRRTSKVLREELLDRFDTRKVERKLDRYINRLQPEPFDIRSVRNELAGLLNNMEIREAQEQGTYGAERHFFIKVPEKQPSVSGEQVKSFAGVSQDAFKKVREANAEHERPAEKVISAAGKLAPGSEEDHRRFQQKIENYLRSTKREELNPERIKQEIDHIFSDPASAKEIVLNHAREIQSSAFVTLLKARKDLSSGEIEQVAEDVQGNLSSAAERILNTARSARSQAGHYVREQVEGAAHAVTRRPATWVESKVGEYLDSINRSELDTDAVKEDLSHMLHDPQATPEILKERFSQFDRESLIALMSSKMPREKAERMVTAVERARDNAMHKAEEAQKNVKQRIERARQEALHQAENTRKAVAAAAWWLFATAVVSGGASAMGGALAV